MAKQPAKDPEDAHPFDNELVFNSLVDQNRSRIDKAIQKHESMQALRIQTRTLIEQKNPQSVMSQVKEFNKDKGFGLQKVVDARRLSS